jgi:hypothetical protein
MPGVTGAKIATAILTSRRRMLRRGRSARGKTEKNAFSTSGDKEMRENLDERIATAFKEGATSDDVGLLIVEAGDSANLARECASRARERALNPRLRPDEIEKNKVERWRTPRSRNFIPPWPTSSPICCRASTPTIAKSLASTIAYPRTAVLYLSPN